MLQKIGLLERENPKKMQAVGKREKTGDFIWRVGLAKGKETREELVEIFPVKAIEWKGWLKPHSYEQ